MAQLFVMDPEASNGEWAVQPLDDRWPLSLTTNPPSRLGEGQDPSRWRAVLVPAGDGRDAWALVASPDSGVRLNGLSIPAGLRSLRDRDEILVPGGAGTVFFSAERLPRVEPFDGVPPDASCPRCRRPLLRETPVVRCPGCSVAHHESAERPCWTYGPTCALCDGTTNLAAGFRWTPEDL